MSETLDILRLTSDDFEKLYAERVEPILRAQELNRGVAMRTFLGRAVLSAIGAAIVGLVAAAFSDDDLWNMLMFGGIAFAMGSFWAYLPLDAVANETKQQSLTAIAGAIGCGYKMNGFQPEALDQFNGLKLLPSCQRSAYEDCFDGTHRGCAYAFYEGHLENKVQTKNGSHWVTVFRGQLIRIAFPKKFLGTTIIRRDRGMFNFMQRWASSSLQPVGLGDSRLEKAFEVYSNDQVEARYLIHPVFMERLLELETAFKGKNLRGAFVDGSLLIAIEGGNKFEVGTMFAKLDDIGRARTIVADLAEVMRVIDAVLTAEQSVLPNETGPASPSPSE